MNKILLAILFTGFFVLQISNSLAWSTNTFNNSLTSENITIQSQFNATRYIEIPSSINFLTTANFSINSNSSEWYFTSENYTVGINPGAYPLGITSNASNFFVIASDNRVYKYLSNFTDTGINYDLTATVGAARGMAYNGSAFFVSDNTGNNIRVYDANFAYINNINVNANITNVRGLAFNNSNWYVLDYDGLVVQYTQNFSYDNRGFIVRGTIGGAQTRGIGFDGANWWIGSDNLNIIKYNQNWGETGENYTLTEMTDLTSIYVTSTNKYVTSTTPQYNTYKYNNSFITNLTILAGSDTIFSKIGIFNLTNSTGNFASIINKYLNSTYLIGTNYIIPFIFHSDTAGVLQYSNLQFNNMGFIENNQSYNSTTYETSIEIFSINVSYDSNEYVNVNAILNYNNINYTATKTTSGNNYIFSKTLDIPLVSTPINVSFYWIINLLNTTGTTTFTTTVTNQTINNINLTVCSTGFLTEALNFTFKDEITFLPINASIEVEYNYYLGSGNVYKTLNFGNSSDNVFNQKFCLSPNITMKISGTTSYYKTGYDKREYFFTNNTISNATQNFDLYLLSTASSDSVTFTVEDQNSDPVTGAYIRILKWDIVSGNFYIIGMLLTDTSGTAIINLPINPPSTWYKYQVIYNNILYLTTDPVKEYRTSVPLSINLLGNQPYNQFDAISSSLTYNNVTGAIVFTYADLTGAIQNMCLVINKLDMNQTTLISEQCMSSTSGVISYTLLTNGTYIVQGKSYLTSTYQNAEKVLNSLVITIGGADIGFITIGKFGQVISLIIIGTLAMIGVASGSIPLGLLLIVVGAIIVNVLKLLSFSYSLIITLIAIILILSLTLKRRYG